MRYQTYDLHMLSIVDYTKLIDRIETFLNEEIVIDDLTGWKKHTQPRAPQNKYSDQEWRDIFDIITRTHYSRPSQRNPGQWIDMIYATTLANHWLIWLVLHKKIRYITIHSNNGVWAS